jgi:hypothetical protein
MLAQSLIISFQNNIESVYLFYSNPVLCINDNNAVINNNFVGDERPYFAL